jgi:hypothetical protein
MNVHFAVEFATDAGEAVVVARTSLRHRKLEGKEGAP